MMCATSVSPSLLTVQHMSVIFCIYFLPWRLTHVVYITHSGLICFVDASTFGKFESMYISIPCSLQGVKSSPMKPMMKMLRVKLNPQLPCQ
jgi:hypothetical protein